LNVDIVTITVDKKKNATTKRTTWISNLLVRDEGLRQAQSLVNPASEIAIALNV